MTSWQGKVVKGIFWFRRVLKPPRKTLDVAASRRENEALAAQFKTQLELNCTPVDAGGVTAEWVVPPMAGPQRVILYLHGGAYNSGSIRSHRSLAANIAQAAKARALVLDYRLAPEHHFPAPVEDAVRAYSWLLSEGVSPGQVIVGGEPLRRATPLNSVSVAMVSSWSSSCVTSSWSAALLTSEIVPVAD